MKKREILRLPTDELVGEIAYNNTLFHDQFNEPYLAVNNSGAKILRINSGDFTGWLNNYAYHRYHGILKNNQANDIKRGLSGLAQFSEENEFRLEPRLCKINDEIWYDLGKEAVCISRNGWKIVNEPPIIFRRYSHQKPQVKPIKGGDIQEFRKFTNITNDDDWNLFLAFAVATLVPDIPKPVLVINGSQGAGKSTPMRMLKELIDPSQLGSAGKITGETEIARLANRHILLFFDNLSFLEKDNSDVLCRLITGDGFSKRRLYSDDDEVIYNFKRPLMMNGINNFITQADLLDRALLLNVERISEEKRRTEIELWSEFDKEKSRILGAFFTVLSKAMKIFPKTPTTGLPRMADFGRWGCAIYNSITNKPFNTFQQILLGNKERQIEESIEADPVAMVAKFFANFLVRVEFTAHDFLEPIDEDGFGIPDAVKYATEHTHWPKDSSQAGKRLRRAEGMLREAGIEMSFVTENNERLIRLVDKSYPYSENLDFMRFSYRRFQYCGSSRYKDITNRRKYASMTPEEYAKVLKEQMVKFDAELEEAAKKSRNRTRAHERKIEREAEREAEVARNRQAQVQAETKQDLINDAHDKLEQSLDVEIPF